MATGTYAGTLRRPGFLGFLWAQFLGAFNDNVCRMVVSLLAVGVAANAAGGSGSLTLVGVVFMLPFFLFSGYAGYLADAFSKRTVLVATKAFEIVAMLLAVPAFLSGRLSLALGVLFLMALQATFFSPAKYGILPEMLPDRELSRANGLLEMTTFVAILIGTAVGGLLYAQWSGHLERIAFILVAIAIIGTLCSLSIRKTVPAAPNKAFSLNPWHEIRGGLGHLARDRVMRLTVVGISYFWFLGALLQMDVILFGKQVLNVGDTEVALLGTALALGIGVGSLVAGRLSGEKVELGLVPIGSFLMGIFSLLLSSSHTFGWACVFLAALGFSGGFFVVPLNALLQQRSADEEKGQMIATNGFLNTAGVLLASGALWTMRDRLGFEANEILRIFGWVTLVANIYVLSVLPDFLIRFSLWLLTHTIYRIRIKGQEHVPFRGPALLVCNHLSFVDGFIVGACVQRFIRFLIYRPYYEFRLLNWLFRLMKAIPVSDGSKRDVVASLEKARQELEQGHVVCIFAEGAISRTGNMLPFRRGFERIVQGLDVPVIPVCLDRLWGSIFCFRGGRFIWKWPVRIPYPVTVSFGAPFPSSVSAFEARQATLELASDAAAEHPREQVHRQFIRAAKRRWFGFSVADSSGRTLTGGQTLVASLLLAHEVRRRCAGERMVAVLLPASVGGALTNLAVLIAGSIPVNLNFTSGREAMASAMAQCGARTIITSKVFRAKAKLDEMPGMIDLEDVMSAIGPVRKAWTAITAFLLPGWFLRRLYVWGPDGPSELVTVMFSSGSTGTPKGVMLSHANVSSNIEALAQLFWVTREDRIVGVLPFFHSFGFTATLWFPLCCGFGAVYHPNPLDAGAIGELIERYRGTILMSTPTFYQTYLRKCSAQQFSSLRYAVVGAEKLPATLADAFHEKFGLTLLEGYGCTEMSPVVSVNAPDFEEHGHRQKGMKRGTVGHPLPGVAATVVHPDTGERLPAGEEGLLLLRGPNRMLGYLNNPEKTAEVFRDGWYVTGDIARIDDDGFIHITDRLARFSKIAGEMVPHIRIEQAVQTMIGEAGCVVTAVPDEHKGERLVIFYQCRELAPDDLWRRLSESELPKLWIPKRDNIFPIDDIPLLPTGKTDLRQIKTMALKLVENA